MVISYLQRVLCLAGSDKADKTSSKIRVVPGFDRETDAGSWTPFYEGLVHGTPVILDILTRHHITATFFFTGDSAKKHPEVVSQVKDAGHEIGCHTLYHETVGEGSVQPDPLFVKNCGPYAAEQLDRLLVELLEQGAQFFQAQQIAKETK